jgi:2-polyprenyl-3-methyl-5-hydroxy-6-metoxy-1,4-benzoquinol methylase
MSKDFWEKNSQSWNRAIQSRLIESRKITNPAIIQEIIRRNPKSVLDLGCGEGWIASQLLPKGIEYTGLDFSPSLVEMARGSHPKASFEAVCYSELVSGAWTKPRDFDLAVFNFSLFDENLRPILHTVKSFIQPTGTILIQTLHPTSLNPYEDGWKTEDFKSFPVPFSGTMPWYGRTLGSWVNLFSESELTIQSVFEPISSETKLPLSIIFSLGMEK